jgi:hypothetical protein
LRRSENQGIRVVSALKDMPSITECAWETNWSRLNRSPDCTGHFCRRCTQQC